jgi:hypothetical protein
MTSRRHPWRSEPDLLARADPRRLLRPKRGLELLYGAESGDSFIVSYTMFTGSMQSRRRAPCGKGHWHAEGRCPERDRAASDPRLRLPIRLEMRRAPRRFSFARPGQLPGERAERAMIAWTRGWGPWGLFASRMVAADRGPLWSPNRALEKKANQLVLRPQRGDSRAPRTFPCKSDVLSGVAVSPTGSVCDPPGLLAVDLRRGLVGPPLESQPCVLEAEPVVSVPKGRA